MNCHNIFGPLFIISFFTNIDGVITVQAEDISYEGPRQHKLVRNEQIFLAELLIYVKELEKLIEVAKRYTTSFNMSTSSVLKWNCTHNDRPSQNTLLFGGDDEWGSEMTKNPILILQLLYRLNSFLPPIEDQVKSHKMAEIGLLNLMNRPDVASTSKVGLSGLQDNMQSLIYLLLIYDIKLNDLETGRLLQVETRSGLTVEDFLHLGNFAQTIELYSWSINLFRKGRQIIRDKQMRGHDLTKFEETLSLQLDLEMKNACTLHDKLFEDSNGTLPFLFQDKVSSFLWSLWPNEKNSNLAVHHKINETFPTSTTELPEPVKSFTSLCQFRGRKADGRAKSTTKCFLFSKIHPYWLLSPLKVEVHSKDPFIIQLYDILTDSQLHRMKEEGTNFVPSKVVSYEGDVMSDASRVSSVTYIESDQLQLAQKVELFTGLRAVDERDAEELQIGNYATGGHFLLHLDPIKSHENVM